MHAQILVNDGEPVMVSARVYPFCVNFNLTILRDDTDSD